MSVSPVECPSTDQLEGVAAGGETSAELRDHLVACISCRQTLERMREDNRFLSRFAIDGALLTAPFTDRTPDLEFPGYDIVREIHRGGQGVVYQAVQRSTKRDVAIKVMKQGPFATLADRVRFEREVETLGRINHPNIVAVHDAGLVAGFHYFVMNYIDGRALDEIAGFRSMGKSATLNPQSEIVPLIRLFVKICDAVHAAHLRGIIHRDLKPSNIRVDSAGEPYVLDFGLAKSADAPRDSVMTETGQFVGSLPWASPEQVEGTATKVDLRTDVYSLGTILFQLLTGVLPFDVGSNLRQSIDHILFREPQRPSTVTAAAGGVPIDDELDTIVLKCLSKDRDRRYQSAGDLALDLKRYLDNEPIEAKRDSAIYILRKTLKRYRLRVAIAGAFVVLFAVSSVVMAFLYRRSTRLEQDAVRSAASLAELLSQNNIEQGRMAGLLGNIAQAEKLLWGELLTHRHGGDDASIHLNDPPGPPEAYWALWEVYRRHPCLRTLTPQPAGMRTVTIADDGKSLWTADHYGYIQKLDEGGNLLDSFRIMFPSAIGLPLVDPGGTWVLKYDTHHYALWRRGGVAQPVMEFPRSYIEIGGFHWSRSGKRFAATTGTAAAVWDIDPLHEVARFASTGVDLIAVAISNDDRRLAVRDRGGDIHVWDIDAGKKVAGTHVGNPRAKILQNFGAIKFSPDDRRLADSWEQSPGRIWNLDHNPPTYMELSERPGSHRLQSFSPDGSLLVIGDIGGELRVFDAQSGKCQTAFVAHSGRIRSVAMTGDGRGVWTSCDDDLRLWEVGADAGARVVRVSDESFHTVDISPDGKQLIGGGGMGKLRRVDRETEAITTFAFGNESTISCVAISPDGRHEAAATYGDSVYLWNNQTPASPPLRLQHPTLISSVCFSPDSRRIVTACDDRIVRIWRCEDGVLERDFPKSADRMPQLAFEPNGKRLAGVVRNGELLVWDVGTGEHETWSAVTNSPLRAVRFSPDGRWLIVAGANRVIEIWDTSLRRRETSLVGHNQEVFCLDFNPQGDMIASGDNGGVIRLWHATLRRPLATLDGHTGPVMALRFAPDGLSLVSASLDGTLRLWDLTYYQRHIAGNFEAQLQRYGMAEKADPARIEAWRRWMGLRSGVSKNPPPATGR